MDSGGVMFVPIATVTPVVLLVLAMAAVSGINTADPSPYPRCSFSIRYLQ